MEKSLKGRISHSQSGFEVTEEVLVDNSEQFTAWRNELNGKLKLKIKN